MNVVVLENIRSLHNVGAVFRTADGAGWEKVYLTGYTGAPPDRRIEKVSLGAEHFIAWEKVPHTPALLEELKKAGFTLVALERPREDSLPIPVYNLFTYKKTLPEKLALVLGNEVEGVHPDTLRYCEWGFEIPMLGKKESLNVSVAAGIAFYQIQYLKGVL